MLKKFPTGKINVTTKMHSFFFCGLQLITVLLLIRNSYTNWSTMFVSLKLCVGFSISYPVSSLLKFIFLSRKSTDLLTLKPHYTFQNKIEKLRTVWFPDIWFLSCNKKFENSMISAWVGAPQKLTLRRTF